MPGNGQKESPGERGGSLHASKPPEGLTCMLTWDDIDEEEYVEYRTAPSGRWHVSKYGASAVRQLLKTNWDNYMSNVEKASKDCAAAVRRLVTKGPPLYLHDPTALPVPDDYAHVDMLWFCATDKEVAAKLEGALEGEAREALWAEQREILAAMEQAEGAHGGEGKDESKGGKGVRG